MIEASWIDV